MSIARAMLQSWFLLSIGIQPIIILDEPTSALDTLSEKIIILEIDELNINGCTVITIAHRLSTISNYDRIIVLKEGSIVEQGSHSELMTKQAEYHNMVRLQTI